MTINNATVEQINVALLDIDKKIKALNTDSETIKSLQNSIKAMKSSLNETQAGLTSGATYDINISGNASTATNANHAETATIAETATNANHAATADTANTATSANISKTLDTVNGDKLQIGSGTAQNITNAKHAATADKAKTAENADYATNADKALRANEADHAKIADKITNALTVNGKTYDGSSAVNAGVQTVANGGTGVTSQEDINKAFISNLDVGTSDVTDGTEFVSSYASDNGFSSTEEGSLHTPYKRKFIKVWNYIKDKISSVLGLTKDNYGGKASTAGNADKVDNYHANQLWRSDGATWNPGANVTMTPSGNGDEWSFDFRNKNGATGLHWHVWDENKNTLLKVNADDGKVSAPYGFVGNLSGKADTAGKASFLDEYVGAGGTRLTSGNIIPKDASEYGGMRKDVVTSSMVEGYPNTDGHLLTMFWDNAGRWDSQLFVANTNPSSLKVRSKANGADYGPWVDIRTAADTGYLCKLYPLAFAKQTDNVILLGKIPDPASTEAPATPSSPWDIDVDFYFIRPQGHKAAWCNVKAGYGYSNAWRKYGFIETFGVDANSNYTNPFYLVTVKYDNEYYIGVRHMVNIDGDYVARVKYVYNNSTINPSTVDNTPLVNMLKVIPFQKTTDGAILNSEVKTSIVDFPNTYAPTVIRNGGLLLKSGYVKIGTSGVAGAKLVVQGSTKNSNSYTDTNPKLEFKNNDDSQNISLTFTDYDAVQAPASLTLNGSQGNEYFIAPCIKASNKLRIPIGAPSSLEDGCIWIER